jgi:hypothetical protein
MEITMKTLLQRTFLHVWLKTFSLVAGSLVLMPSLPAQGVKPPPNIAASVGIPAYKPPQWRITVKSKPEYIHGEAYYVYTVTNISDIINPHTTPSIGYICRKDYRLGSPLMGEKAFDSNEAMYYCPATVTWDVLKGVIDRSIRGAPALEINGDAVAFSKMGFLSSHSNWKPWTLRNTERNGVEIYFESDVKNKSSGLLPGQSVTMKLALKNNQLNSSLQTMHYAETEWDSTSDNRPKHSYFVTRVYPIIIVP